jgi:predicted MFS family arabinose efflux permease
MGVSTDRRSIRVIFAIAFLLMSLGRSGLLITRSLPILCGFAFVGSFGGQFVTTAANSMFFKIGGRDNLQSAGMFMLLRMVAMASGALIGGFVIDAMSFRTAFWLTVSSTLTLAFMSLLLPRTEAVVLKLQEYRKSVFTRDVLFLAAVFSLSSLHWGAESVAYSPFLRQTFGLSLCQMGVFIAPGYAMVGVGSVLAVVLLKRGWVHDLRHILVYGLLLSGACHVLMCIPQLYVSFAFRVLHEVGDGLVMLAYYHGIAKVFHLDRIGGCGAFMMLCMSMTAMASAVAFGYVGDQYGHQWPLIISGLVLMAIPVLLRAGGSFLLERTADGQAQ